MRGGKKIYKTSRKIDSIIMITSPVFSASIDKMEFIIINTLLLLLLLPLFLVVLWFGVRLFYTIWWKPKSIERLLKQQGIHGTPYKLLHGDLKEYAASLKEAWSKPMNLTHDIVPRVIPFILQTLQNYGKICVFWFGTNPRMIIMDPQLMKEILSNKSGHFQKPPLNPLIELLTMGLSSLEREKWAKHRGIMKPAFHLDKLKEMVPAFTTSSTELIERLNGLVSSQGGSCEVDIQDELNKFTGDVISRTAFGSNFEEGKRIFHLQKEQAVLVIEASQSVYIPGFRFIPTKKNRRRMDLDKEIKSILRDLINKKEQAIKSGDSNPDDLLGLLLQCNNNLKNLQENIMISHDSKKKNKNQMSIEEVIEECKLFYFAGQETTSTWLTWTMIILCIHPEWQDKAREEVFQIFGKNLPNKFEAMNHLKIMTMILYEVLRLYPPIIHQFRHTYKETKIGDSINLPAGVQIMLPTLLIHHDPEIWGEDAQEFKPERFSEGISKATKDNYKEAAFLPFGWGPRICLGQNFAMIEAKMALAMILQQFSFELSPSYTHAPHTIITLQPQHGAPIILHRL